MLEVGSDVWMEEMREATISHGVRWDDIVRNVGGGGVFATSSDVESEVGESSHVMLSIFTYEVEVKLRLVVKRRATSLNTPHFTNANYCKQFHELNS